MRVVPGVRPRMLCTTVLGTLTLAFSELPFDAEALPTRPGSALAAFNDRICALTSTSIFGTVYDTRPRSEVIHGSVTSQDSSCWLTLARTRFSGNLAADSQLLRTPRPVLVPPCSVKPLRSRALRLTSTPCQYCVRAGP